MIKDEYLKLLTDKNTILKEIFKYTKSKEFKVSEDDANELYFYIKNRDELFDKLSKIESQIKVFVNDNIKNKDIEDIIKENNLIINEIIKLDKLNKERIEAISNLLKKEIKSVKEVSKVNKSYLGTYENTVGGNLFDSSR